MAKLTGDSAVAGVPAVKGTNTAKDGVGVEGGSDTGWGVHGHSKSGRGVVASSETDYGIRAHSKASAGLRASSDEGRGLEGWSTRSEGVHGISVTGAGVQGTSDSGIGVVGESKSNEGVRGVSHGSHAGVVGINDTPPHPPHQRVAPPGGGNGGWFESNKGEGVRGTSKHADHGGVVGVNTVGGIGVYGTSDNGVGVSGVSVNNEGMHAASNSNTTAAMAVYQLNPDSERPALYAKHAGHRAAAVFEGNVVITGDISLTNADCAEDFDIAPGSPAEPGTVMVLDGESRLHASVLPYDKRVAGVISGAGHYKPGLVLDKQPSQNHRKPIALLGKVYCKVDAQFGPIAVGDLLTTSPTAGHAMRVDDPQKAFGAVIGKALRPLTNGQGLLPILIALQ